MYTFALAADLATNADSALIKVRKELNTKPNVDQRVLIGTTVYTVVKVTKENKRDDSYNYYTVRFNRLAVSASAAAAVTWLPTR